jgi:chromosomal replication initiation ATPase DnaA
MKRIASIRRYLNEYGYDVSHSTILHGYRKAKENVDSDKDYKSLVRRLQDVQ